jgi:hypothetical protein
MLLILDIKDNPKDYYHEYYPDLIIANSVICEVLNDSRETTLVVFMEQGIL